MTWKAVTVCTFLMGLSRLGGALAAAEGPAAPEASLAERPTISGELPLRKALDLAQQYSPLLKQRMAGVDAARAETRMAQSEGRLRASTSAFLSTGTLSNILSSPGAVMPQMRMLVPDTEFADLNLMLMYPLSTGGRIPAQVGSARAMRRAAEAELAMADVDVAFMVKAAYWRVLYAMALERVYERQVAENEERLRIDAAAVAAGKLPPVNELRDRAELADAQQMLADARRDRRVALVDLRTVLGIAQESDVTLSDPLESPPFEGSLDSLMPELANRPELVAARHMVTAAENRIAAAKSAYRPQVDAMAMTDAMTASGMKGDAGVTVGVVAGLPILDGGERRAQVNLAQAELRTAREKLSQIELDSIRELYAAWEMLQTARQNIGTAQAGVTAAEEDYRLMQTRYETGNAVNVEALDALTALERAQSNLWRAWFEYDVAVAEIERAVGRK